MRKKTYRAYVVFVVMGLVLPACGQSIASQAIAHCEITPIRREPYSVYTAEFKITTVKMLADGTTVTRVAKEIRSADSHGHILIAKTKIPALSGQPAIMSYMAFDSTDRLTTTWDSQHKLAKTMDVAAESYWLGCIHKSKGLIMIVPGPPPEKFIGGLSDLSEQPLNTTAVQEHSSNKAASTGAVKVPKTIPRKMVKIVREDLGTKMIFGLEAQGHRITDLSVASGVGDNRIPVYMREYWSAPCLGMIVSEVIDDPQTGKEIRELVSLSLNEPDPATFRPPKGYKIVAENVTSCAQLSPQ